MTLIERHKNISDARSILVIARSQQPHGTPVDELLASLIRKLQAQMVILEREILADTSGKCDSCEAELLDVNTHDGYDCPALDGMSNYPAEGYGPGQRYA